MADLLKTGAAWLANTIASHAATSVTFNRSGTQLSLSATRGRSEFVIPDSSGVSVTAETVDWIVASESMYVDGTAIEPQQGDTVIDESGVIHEVAQLPGQAPWRWCDNSQTMMRIHTKRTARRLTR